MKTEIVEEDGLFVLRCKESKEELDVFNTKLEAEESQKDVEKHGYCNQ